MQRSGLQTFARTVHSMCRLFGSYRGVIVLAVNGLNIPQERKDELIALINTIDSACSAVDLILTRYER